MPGAKYLSILTVSDLSADRDMISLSSYRTSKVAQGFPHSCHMATNPLEEP